MTAGAEYRALAKRYRHLPELVVRAGAKEIQRSVLARLDRDSKGDRVLSGAPGHVRLGVTTSVQQSRTFAEASLKPSPRRNRGQWHWLEFGTKVRIVGEDGERVQIDGKWYTGPWSAGRSPAKHTFTKGSADGVSEAERAMAAEFEKAVG